MKEVFRVIFKARGFGKPGGGAPRTPDAAL